MKQWNTLGVAHHFLEEHVREGMLCIDATAGRGGDTAFLCRLVGETGHVIALDIQEEAVASTRERLEREGLAGRAEVHRDSHSNMERYADPETVDAVTFNFGWLPGGDHRIFTRAETSIPAIQAGLRLLKPGGVMSLCLYYGGASGYEERDALLPYLKTLDHRRYTVLCCSFWNRPNDPPIPVLIQKDC